MDELVFGDHHRARVRHAERQARGLAAFAARRLTRGRRRPARDRCPLSLLAAWIVARREQRGGGPIAFQGR